MYTDDSVPLLTVFSRDVSAMKAVSLPDETQPSAPAPVINICGALAGQTHPCHFAVLRPHAAPHTPMARI